MIASIQHPYHENVSKFEFLTRHVPKVAAILLLNESISLALLEKRKSQKI